jgi:hypothetical protein
MNYKEILNKAKTIKQSVEKEYKLPFSTPVYYICKAILKPKTDVKSVKVEMASKSQGDYISNQIYKTTYLGMAERLTKYVEQNGKLPNYITAIVSDKTYKIKVSDYVYMFSRILIYYDTNGKLPSYANVNSKSFTKPTETGNTVYDYFTKRTGYKPKTLDDILTYVANHFTYQYYYDDYKSNQQVTESKAGNCVDLLQWLCNMVEPLGYEWKCVHVSCRSSGTGHVWGKFRHPTNTGGEWVNRDPAAVASNGSIHSMWCEDGYVNAYNPSWWMANLRR